MLVYHPLSKSLPNLGRLSLTSTGVELYPDGSALLSPGEWADASRLLNFDVSVPIHSATPPAPVPAPVPASNRRRPRDDSSGDERARARVRSTVLSPAPVPAQVPSRVLGERTASRSTVSPPAPVPALTLLPLSADNLASILGGIGRTEQSKASACKAAQNLCETNVQITEACRSYPTVWRELAESIFKYDGSDDIFGEGLIYDTFRNDASAPSYDNSRPLAPRSAFNNMCVAKGLANVLAKRFVAFGLRYHERTMLETWAEEGCEISDLNESEFEDLSWEDKEKIQLKSFPDLEFADDASKNAMEQFKNEPLHALFLDKYKEDPIFNKLVHRIFQSTAKFLFSDGSLDYMSEELTTIDVAYMVGKVIGVYIVCLWKREHAHENFRHKHDGDESESPMEEDTLEELLVIMQSNSEILRSKLATAVIKTVYQEDYNPEEVDYSKMYDLPEELTEYQTAPDFEADYKFDEPPPSRLALRRR